MYRLNKGTNLPKKRLLKHKTNPKMLRNLAVGLILALMAALVYIKVSPFTHDAKQRIKFEQTIIQTQKEKEKLQEEIQKGGSESDQQKKQIEDLNKKLQETEAALQAKRNGQKVYAATRPQAVVGNEAKAQIYQRESGNCPTKWQGEHGDCPAYHGTPTDPNVGYGLCQSTPAWKMASAGSDWATSYATQDKWCTQYANDRYGGWSNAYSSWLIQRWW